MEQILKIALATIFGLVVGKLISWERSRTLDTYKAKLRPSHDTGILGLGQLVSGAFNKLQARQIIH